MLLNAVRATTASRRAARSAPDTAPARPRRFTEWRRSRPLIGGLLVILGGVEMFFSGQLDFGELHIQLGIEGLQATVIPIALVLLGILSIAMPVHRIFYGVLTLAVAVYSLVGVNLGGFFVGMILSSVGGIVVVSWAPRIVDAAAAADEPVAPADDETPLEVRELFATEGRSSD